MLPSVSHRETDELLETIYAAATELFVARGIDGFSIPDLALQLGLGPLELYRWFEDKNSILAAVRTRAFSRLTRALERTGAGSSLVCSSPYRAYLEHASRNSAEYRLTFCLVQSREVDYPELIAARTRASEAIQQFFIVPFLNARVCGDLDLISRAAWASVHGAVMLALTGNLQGASLEQVVEETLSTFMKALECRNQQASHPLVTAA